MGTSVIAKEIVIWTNMGRSLMFKNVTMFKYHTQGFEFNYVGDSTGVSRHANFNNTSVVGFAITDMQIPSACV